MKYFIRYNFLSATGRILALTGLFTFYGSTLLTTCFLLSSCDKVKDPYGVKSTGVTPTGKVRKVLLEDYTGHLCTNCPPAAQTAQTIKGIYGSRLVIMAVHAGFYANTSAAPYNYDFTTAIGDIYFNQFGISSNPIGMVNRKDYPGNHLKNVSDWGSIVDSLMAKAPDADIQITNNYNSSSRVLNTTVSCKFLNLITSGTYNLVVLLTEDSIQNAQKDASQTPPDILNYYHRDVLRDGITTANWGDSLKTGPIAAGDSIVKTYQYTLPATFKGMAPVSSHCHVVAYVYNASTYEIMQVEEKKIQ